MRIRMKTAVFIAVIVCLVIYLAGCTPKTSPCPVIEPDETDSKLRVVGYLPDWSYYSYNDLDFAALSHLNIAFCNPDNQGNLSCGIPNVEFEKIVNKAHSENVKVFAALGGGGGCDGYLQLLDTPEKMTDFNNKIIQFCETHGLDGIDLDIELSSDHKIWNYYGDWVVSLRALCDERGYELSTATAQWVAVKVTSETYGYFDFVNVMAYDNDSDKTSHSSYAFAEESLTWFNIQRNIDVEKLVLGVPFYGRGYNSNGSLNWNSYESFASLIASDPANYDNNVYNGVAYNGASLIREKCTLAKNYGGIMIWEITLDATGEYSLLEVIKNEMTNPVS